MHSVSRGRCACLPCIAALAASKWTLQRIASLLPYSNFLVLTATAWSLRAMAPIPIVDCFRAGSYCIGRRTPEILRHAIWQQRRCKRRSGSRHSLHVIWSFHKTLRGTEGLLNSQCTSSQYRQHRLTATDYHQHVWTSRRRCNMHIERQRSYNTFRCQRKRPHRGAGPSH